MLFGANFLYRGGLMLIFFKICYLH